MKPYIKLSVLWMTWSIAFGHLYSQDRLSLGMRQDGESLLIYGVPSTILRGLPSNIQFTLKWEGSGKLDSVWQSDQIQQVFPIVRAGEAVKVGQLMYQKFAGFGLSIPTTEQVQWDKDQEVQFLRLAPSSMEGSFTLTDDTWAQENNGEYYFELDGEDITGEKLDSLVVMSALGIQENLVPEVKLYPNPFHNDFVAEFNGLPGNTYIWTITSLHGQEILSGKFAHLVAKEAFNVSVPNIPKGFFVFSIRSGKNDRIYIPITKQ